MFSSSVCSSSFPVNVQPNSAGMTGSWGPVELAAVIAVPVFILCVLVLLGLFIFQHHQRGYGQRQRLEVEDPSTEHLYLAKDKTLQDLIYDLSTSGSGSGQRYANNSPCILDITSCGFAYCGIICVIFVTDIMMQSMLLA